MESEVIGYLSEVGGTWGPWILMAMLMASGVGIPLGEDIFIIPAGILVAQGLFPFWETLIAAYLGVTIADCLWLVVCKRFATRLLRWKWFRRTIHPRRLLETKYQFDRSGVWVVVASRFIPGSRTTVITAAGLLQMRFRTFFMSEWICAIPTTATSFAIGYTIGLGLGMVNDIKDLQITLAVTLAVAGGITAIIFFRRRRGLTRNLPRAKVAWLRGVCGTPAGAAS